MTDAEKAYQAAQQAIAEAKATGDTRVFLSGATDMNALTTLPPEIADLSGITQLLLDNTQVSDLTPLSALKGLSGLSLRGTQVSDLTLLSGLSGLTHLWLDGTQVSDLTPLSGLSGLTVLSLHGTQVSDLTPLSGLSGLTDLGLTGTQVSDLTPLSGLSGITQLLLDNTQVSDLTPLSALKGLSGLSLRGTQVSDLTPLSGLSGLTHLWLDGTQVSDLTPLSGLSGLTQLSLDLTHVSDLTPLSGLSALTDLWLTGTQVSDLTPLSALKGLSGLLLRGTQVSDLTPLSGLSGLTHLWLDGTQVSDLTPLSGLSGLTVLWLTGTQVSDLRPLRPLRALGKAEGRGDGIGFANTPAARSTPRLAEIAAMRDTHDRSRALFAWLDEEGDTPLTVAALLEAQDQTGWQFSPNDGAMRLHVQPTPDDPQRTQMARLVRERLVKLADKLSINANSAGIRHEVLTEAKDFVALLDDNNRSLPDRSLDFWSGLMALGGQLEANDTILTNRGDPLDCLRPDDRAALQTALTLAAGFVRSFPQCKDLDEAYTGFSRTALPVDVLDAILRRAVEQGFVVKDSAKLIEDVSRLGQQPGTQGDKAYAVTRNGSKNLLKTAAMLGLLGVSIGGVAAGVTSDIGTDISNHYELSEHAIAFIDSLGEDLFKLINGLEPDEKAILKSLIQDLQDRRSRKKSLSSDPL